MTKKTDKNKSNKLTNRQKAQQVNTFAKFSFKNTGLKGGAVVKKKAQLYDSLVNKSVSLNNYKLKQIKVSFTEKLHFKITPITSKGSILKTRSLSDFKKQFKPSYSQRDLFTRIEQNRDSVLEYEQVRNISNFTTLIAQHLETLTDVDKILNKDWYLNIISSDFWKYFKDSIHYSDFISSFKNENLKGLKQHLDYFLKFSNSSKYVQNKLTNIINELDTLGQAVEILRKKEFDLANLKTLGDDYITKEYGLLKAQATNISQQAANLWATHKNFLTKTTAVVPLKYQEQINIQSRHGVKIK